MKNKNVLVGVLKKRKDLRILFKDHWYRIPLVHRPKRKFEFVAFYQPSVFGRKGKRIEYYARVSGVTKTKRIKLLPEEPNHPRAEGRYLKINFGKIFKLQRPVKNVIPRRVSFGYTDINTLLSSKNILELYGVPPIEQIVEKQLNHAGIKTIREFCVSEKGKRVRIDIAILLKHRKIAVECDNADSHNSRVQLENDKKKNQFLRSCGWKVVRLKECDILDRLNQCVRKVEKAVQNV